MVFMTMREQEILSVEIFIKASKLDLATTRQVVYLVVNCSHWVKLTESFIVI